MEDSYIAASRYFKVHEFNLHDALSILIIGAVILLVGNAVKKKHLREKHYQKYFMPGLVVKTLGGLGYALVYTYYYTYGGDTSGFWYNGVRVFEVLIYQPEYWWDVFTRNFDTKESFVFDFLKSMRFANDWEEYRMVQFSSLIAPLALMNFFAGSMLLAAICYAGVWRLFLTFRSYYPMLEKHMAIAVLFVPSVVFWGSGIMKDTVVFASVGLIIYSIDQMVKHGMLQWRLISVLLLAVFLAFSMKAYVVFCLAPAILIWQLLKYRNNIRSGILRTAALPLFLVVSTGGALGVIQFVGSYNPQYALENFIAGAQSMQGWHYQEGANTSEQFGRGSSYTLGEYEPNLRGVLKVAPAAVNVTLFRPYIWETTTLMQLFAALESLAILLLTIYILLGKGPVRVFKVLNNDAFLLMLLTFSLLFAFGVGFSAYNFGALSRYKVPCIPFFVAGLFVLQYRVGLNKAASRMSKPLKHKNLAPSPKLKEQTY